MNKKRIIRDIMANMPDDIKNGEDVETKKIRARYLYLELCRRCHYNVAYNLANEDTQNKMFNGENDDEKEEGICNEFSKIGVELFEESNISAIAVDVDGEFYDEKRKMKQPLHVYMIFSLDERDKLGNRKFYLADPSFDIKRVQIGCATKYFASNPITSKNLKGYPKNLCVISNSELKQIDTKLGYIYTDDIRKKIILNAQTKSNEEISEFDDLIIRVEIMLEELHDKLFSKHVTQMSISDRQSAYKMLFHEAFPNEMTRGIIDFEIIKEGEGYISTLTVKKDKKNKKYISNETGKYIPKGKMQDDVGEGR